MHGSPCFLGLWALRLVLDLCPWCWLWVCISVSLRACSSLVGPSHCRPGQAVWMVKHGWSASHPQTRAKGGTLALHAGPPPSALLPWGQKPAWLASCAHWFELHDSRASFRSTGPVPRTLQSTPRLKEAPSLPESPEPAMGWFGGKPIARALAGLPGRRSLSASGQPQHLSS